MIRLLLTVFICLIPPWASAEDQCTGTTEQRLECQAPNIKMFLRSWVSAWADGDFEGYLSHYTTGRSPRSDMTREEWEAHRRARISPDQDIKIDLKLESMGLEDSGIYDVVFVQHYRSETYSDQVRKRLFLLPEAGKFRIFKEEAI